MRCAHCLHNCICFKLIHLGAVLFLFAAGGTPGIRAQELPGLPPITTDELKMTEVTGAPGGKAVVLYYSVDTDNNHATETVSVRMKILREEGFRYANIDIPYLEKVAKPEAIRARTIASDGKIAEFGGEILDNDVLKSRKIRLRRKTIALPNVQVGTIVEYSYQFHGKGKVPDAFTHPFKYDIQEGYTYPAAEWEVQRELYVLHEHFVLHLPKGTSVRSHFLGNVKPDNLKTEADGIVSLDLTNVPAYEEEEYSPPARNLRWRVDLYYALGFTYVDDYWISVAKRRATAVDAFIGKSKMIQREAAQLAGDGKTDEEKLRRLYARAAQIRNLSYEGEKTEKQLKHESLGDNKNAEDVLIHGYGWGNEANLLFLALARAAGYRAAANYVADKDLNYFDKALPYEEQLSAMVVYVEAGDRAWHLDPASPLCPFGLLPWDESHASGVIASLNNPRLHTTPAQTPADSVSEKEGNFKLSEDGKLTGNAKVSYRWEQASYRRRDFYRKDHAERKEAMEKSLKSDLLPGALVSATSMDGWDRAEGPLEGKFEIEVPEFASVAGKRMILPASVFDANQVLPFASPKRTYSICFEIPEESREAVNIELPAGLEVEAIPENQEWDQKAFYYKREIRQEGSVLHLERTFRAMGGCYDAENYTSIRVFYQRMLTGDSAKLTLLPAKGAAKN